MSESNDSGKLQNYSVDQAAGAVVLVLGAVASLLLVVWQSKCLCKVNLCYIFQCERRPPNEDELETLKEQADKLKNKKDKIKKKKMKKDDKLTMLDNNREEEFIDANEEEEDEEEEDEENQTTN
tara:strand:+ start:2798 stop:3169 length:372 start_codon:yes stop_codon:yes gene_type:complete